MSKPICYEVDCIAMHFINDGFWVDSRPSYNVYDVTINLHKFLSIHPSHTQSEIELLDSTEIKIFRDVILVNVTYNVIGNLIEFGIPIPVKDIINVDFLNPLWSYASKVKYHG